MRKIYLLLVLFMGILYYGCQNEEMAELQQVVTSGKSLTSKNVDGLSSSQLSALQAIEEMVSDEMEIYISDKKLMPNSVIYPSMSNSSITSPNEESWFVFIDDIPLANWTHPCRYVFVTEEGTVTAYEEQSVPTVIREMKAVQKLNVIETNVKTTVNTRNSINNPNTSGHLWAVIISGGYNILNNHIRYWNDCSEIYKVLINDYNYQKSHIYVAMSDGTNPEIDLSNGTSSNLDLDGDGIADIGYDATRASLHAIFTELASKMTNKDDLFVFTIDHGGRENGISYLDLWNEGRLYPSELATYLNNIPSRKQNVVMGQCYSGGFIDALKADNRVIATACRADERSFSTSDYLRDEFVYHWTEAVASGEGGYVSAYNAFDYAKWNDRQSETPQYSSQDESTGKNLSLAGNIYRLDVPDLICFQNSGMIGISDSNIIDVDWSLDNCLTEITSSDRTITVKYMNATPYSSTVSYAKVQGLLNLEDGEKFLAKSSVMLYNPERISVRIIGESDRNTVNVSADGTDNYMTDWYWTFPSEWSVALQGRPWTIADRAGTINSDEILISLNFTDACGTRQRVVGTIPYTP